MSNLVTDKDKRALLATQITIVLLLVFVVIFGLLTAHKLLVKEPALTPQEVEFEAVRKAVKSNPENKEARLLLGYYYQKNDDLVKAEKEYKETLKLDTKNVAALYNLGVITQTQKDFKESEKYYKKAIELKPNHVLATIGLGEIYLETNKYDEAIKVLETTLKFEQQLINPRILMANAYEQKGNVAKAIEEYKIVLQFVPKDKDALEALKRLETKEAP